MMKRAFDVKYPPATLATELNKKKKTLKRLRYKVINTSQWKLLYPAPPGSPDSQNFDITLFTILFRNICEMSAPATGWDALPPDSDTSIAADIARIKFYRNKVYAHRTSTEIDDSEFEILWVKISKVLINRGIPSSELGELKEAPLSPEEDDYIQELKEWYEKELELIKEINLDTNAGVKELLTKVAKVEEVLQKKSCGSENNSEVDKLGKCNFTGKIESLNEKFLSGSRQWLFDELSNWFTNKDSNSRVMILTAGPGVGKSVFAAEVCKMYAGQLAACHFCQYNQSDYRNPRMIIESLASIMCDNVPGFKAKLNDQLKRSHSKETLSDAFRVLINDPLHALENRGPMMLVIDALDETEVGGKSEFLELISDEFPKLPPWIKILITSRPELPVQEKLEHLNPVEIASYGENNTNDILKYLQTFLSSICNDDNLLESLAWKCSGSFLYAYHAQIELNRTTKKLTSENLFDFLPKGICDFYRKQMERLKKNLQTLSPSEVHLKPFLEMLVAAKGPLPLSLLPECLGLPDNALYKVREAINEVMSSILPVYEDCMVVYHKSFVDWLISDGYKEHAFTVDSQSGHQPLWTACEEEFNRINLLNKFSNFKPSPMTKYALRNGIAHMIRSGSIISYHWSVNVKIVHARTTIVQYKGFKMTDEWRKIVENSFSSLTGELLHEINWHIRVFDCEYEWPHPFSLYLQLVANRTDCKRETRSLARSLLQQSEYFWFEDLNSTQITNNLRMSVSLRTDVTCINVSPDEQLVAVGYKDGWISIYNVPDFKELRNFNTNLDSRIHCSSIFEPDNSMLLYDRYGRFFGVTPPKFPFFGGDYGALWSCSFSPSGNRLVTCDGSEEIKLWDVNNANLLGRLQAGGPVDCSFFSDCGLFIVASKEREEYERRNPNDVFTVWNALTLQRVDRRNIRSIPQDVASFGVCTIQRTVVLPDGNKTSQLLLSNDGSDIDVFQLPDALLAACLPKYCFQFLVPFTISHWHNCVLHHTNQSERFSNVNRLETLVMQQRWIKALVRWGLPICYRKCPCQYLKESRVVPVKVQKLYVEPIFSKLNIFSVEYQTKSIQPSSTPEPYTVTSCCFSPDGSFLATCANGGRLSVAIWDTKICTIVDVLQLELNGVVTCWWTDGWLWIFDDGASLFKIPISKEGNLASKGAKEVKIDPKPAELLTFSDILIFIDQKSSVNIARFVNGYLQYVEKFSAYTSLCAAVSLCSSVILTATCKTFCVWKENLASRPHSIVSNTCAAVSPCSSVILTATCKTFRVWKENPASRPHWVVSNTGELPDLPFEKDSPPLFLEDTWVEGCITTDGTRGVLALFPWRYIVVVELESSRILRLSTSSVSLEDGFCAGNSYFIGVNWDEDSLEAEKLTNGKSVAEWNHPRVFGICSTIVAHSRNDLIAIVSSQCNVQFLRLVVPE